MSIYVIGPVNGYLSGLELALEQLGADPLVDQLWFSGNVVGEGPDNVALIKWLQSLDNQAVAVMGRQEFLLLAMSEQVLETPASHSFNEIIESEHASALLKWLAKRPFMYSNNNYLLVHAGMPTEWSFSQALTFALEIETTFASTTHKVFFENMMKAKPAKWNAKLHGWMRARFLVNAFTRMGYTGEKARNIFDLDLDSEEVDSDLMPWYCLPDRVMRHQKIITARALKSIIPPPRNIIPVQAFEQRDKLNIIRLDKVPEHFIFERDPMKVIV